MTAVGVGPLTEDNGHLNGRVGSRRPAASVCEQLGARAPGLSFVSIRSMWYATCMQLAGNWLTACRAKPGTKTKESEHENSDGTHVT